MKKTIIFILFAAVVFSALSVTAAGKSSYTVYVNGKENKELVNGSFRDSVKATGVTVKAGFDIYGIYVQFTEKASDMTVCFGTESVICEADFLHKFVDLSASPDRTVSVSFGEGAVIAEVSVYGREIPDDVQRWEPPCEHADLMLCTTHADDEQLFFAGVLPYYARERGFEVQVVYFTDHKYETKRRHELLDGLWTVGVRHYPVIGILPDEYSRSKNPDDAYDWALENAKSEGVTLDDLVAFQTEQIRRFKPLIAVCHDLRGEYGHGQHVMNVRTFLSAAEKSADETFLPELAEQYGAWEVKKIYVHLYKENEIIMDWDTPLESFGGLTAFQVTQKGFKCHYSQRNTWFADWLYGEDRTLSKAADIYFDPLGRSDCCYSPCRYGLYSSTVGPDVLKNDMAENIETYKMKAEREEAERIAEQLRLEEESRRAESESIAESIRIAESESISAAEESLRIYESESLSIWESESLSEYEEESRRESEEESLLESEAESLEQAAESKRVASSESKRLAEEERTRKLTRSGLTAVIVSCAVSFAVMTVIFIMLYKKRV